MQKNPSFVRGKLCFIPRLNRLWARNKGRRQLGQSPIEASLFQRNIDHLDRELPNHFMELAVSEGRA